MGLKKRNLFVFSGVLLLVASLVFVNGWAEGDAIPLPPEYLEHIASVSEQYGIPEGVIPAIIENESAFTIGVRDSVTQDRGLCQINQVNWQWLYNEHGLDVSDPFDNIECAAVMLSQFLEKYDLYHALACYARGEAGMLAGNGFSYADKIMRRTEYYAQLMPEARQLPVDEPDGELPGRDVDSDLLLSDEESEPDVPAPERDVDSGEALYGEVLESAPDGGVVKTAFLVGYLTKSDALHLDLNQRDLARFVKIVGESGLWEDVSFADRDFVAYGSEKLKRYLAEQPVYDLIEAEKYPNHLEAEILMAHTIGRLYAEGDLVDSYSLEETAEHVEYYCGRFLQKYADGFVPNDVVQYTYHIFLK